MEPKSGAPRTSVNFEAVARNALAYLRAKTNFRMWMVTRVEGDDWIVLNLDDGGYGVVAPKVFRWSDSFCSRMVLGLGPRVAPSSKDVPAYAAAPIASQVEIGSYIGVPLVNGDGTLFGTLCGIDPHAQPDAIRAELPLVELIAGMLSGVLAAEIKGTQLSRQAERHRVDAETDSLTGLCNRRGWDRALSVEELNCQRYGYPAHVLVVDLDELKLTNDTQGHAAGDDLIVCAAMALKAAVRKFDLVARVGGDEFQILCVECDSEQAAGIAERVKTSFVKAGVRASFGMAKRLPTAGLEEAVRQADRAMYADKQFRKGRNQRQAAIPEPASV